MLMVHPDLVNVPTIRAVSVAGEVPFWNIFGFEIAKVGYQGRSAADPVCGIHPGENRKHPCAKRVHTSNWIT